MARFSLYVLVMNDMKKTAPLFAAALLFALSVTACSDGDDYRGPPMAPGGNNDDSSSPSASSSSGDEHPRWLVGPSWTKGYKVENNIAFESEDGGMKFGGAPSYDYEEKVGKSWTKRGTWKVTSGTIVLSSGDAINLSTAVKANCRIIARPGKPVLYASSEIETCPTAKPLSSTECLKAGSYVKSTTSGTSSSSYTSSTSYELDPDGVLVFTTSSSRSTCYGSTCKTLANSSAPIVGRWWLEGGSVRSDASSATSPSLTGFTFTKTTESCGR